MTDRLRFTILGCGSSGGVPRIGGNGWGECDPGEPRNARRRCSLLVERLGDDGVTRVLIDTSPDMRAQLLDVKVSVLDAVVYTHAHADHTNGIDDLRQVVFNRHARLPVWADATTRAALMTRFDYVFVQPEGSNYPPILDMHLLEGDVTVEGAGGPVVLRPFTVHHGAINALGFRIGGLAYLPDAIAIPEDSWPMLERLEVWVVDALRRKPHPTHAHLALTLEWIARVAPRKAVLTNMHNDLDYWIVEAETPPHVTPAFDGMVIEINSTK